MEQNVTNISITKGDFIEYISGIKKILSLNLSFGNTDEETMSNEIQKLDIVHDFGTTRGNNLAKDSLSIVKYTADYSYNSMRLFFIQKYSFPTMTPSSTPNWASIIKPIPIQWFSNISYPGVGQQQRVVNNVEDYCFLLALKNSISKGGNSKIDNFKFVNFQPKEIDTLKTVKKELAEFFSNYTDNADSGGTGKINLLVDTPGDLTKVLKSDKLIDNFAYIFLQESAHDSAKGKPTTIEPQIIKDAYNGNGFCEVFGQSRMYTPGIIEPSNFESNFTINFSGMTYNVSPRESFQTTVTYRKQDSYETFTCILNSLVHPTNVPQITKAVGNFTKGNDLILNKDTMDTLNKNIINEFYKSFENSNYNYSKVNEHLLDFNFTKKRAGDGLQCRVCQLVNSGNNSIKCWKMGTGEAGCDNTKEYTITKLILVTIDRVLFSYCIKNNVPAIYSGTGCFLFFNPLRITERITEPSQVPANSLIMPPQENTFLPGIVTTNNGSIQKLQSGGDITIEDNKNFANQFTDIPFYLYKLLPKIINNSSVINRNLKDQTINLLLNINDDTLTTIYANNRICLYSQDNAITNGLNLFDKNFVVWLNNGDISVEKHTINNGEKFMFITNISNLRFDFNIDNIISAINNASYFSSKEVIKGENGSIPLLDTYYDLILTKDISFDEETLENNNFLSLSAYFNIFSYYESCLCCDNEEYSQSFNNDNNLEVTNKLMMYVMFKFLLDDFTHFKNTICYGLLEYFLNYEDEDKKQQYFAISDDLERVIYYVFSNYKILGKTSKIRIQDMIFNNNIKTNTPIFINTLRYFKKLYPRILQKTEEIEEILKFPTISKIDSENLKYIKKYLSMYGFMNMSNDFQDNIIKTEQSSLLNLNISTDKKISEVLSQSHGVKQKRIRQQSPETLETKIKEGVVKMRTGMDVNANEYEYSNSLPFLHEMTTRVPLRAGRKKSIKYKKRRTRRVQKTKNKNKTIKHKKRRHTTRNRR